MAEKTKKKEYSTVSLPIILLEEIAHVTNIKYKGYTSRAEFVKDSIREKLKTVPDWVFEEKKDELEVPA